MFQLFSYGDKEYWTKYIKELDCTLLFELRQNEDGFYVMQKFIDWQQGLHLYEGMINMCLNKGENDNV